jgi:hypothetical protein
MTTFDWLADTYPSFTTLMLGATVANVPLPGGVWERMATWQRNRNAR